jgi:type II secretion system protein C
MPAKTAKQIKSAAAPTALTLVAVGMLIWAGLDVYQRVQFHQDWKKEQLTTAPTAVTKTQQRRSKNTRQVAKQHLFGQQQKTAQAVKVTKAPATRLNLKLIGVIASKGDGVSTVIIQIDNAEIGVFSVGDKLPRGNAEIERIEATQVLLRRNGKLESLAIIRPELGRD